MASLRVVEAAAAAGGRVVAGDPQALLHGAAIDSRSVRGGELFFAFAGAHADGHRFVGDAFERGAAAAMVQDLAAADAPSGRRTGLVAGPAVIQVADTFAALHDLARSVRARVPRRLVGITGSAGKTTTKELLAAMLARRYRVARNPGNFNNLYGFPLALLNVPDDTEWMVAEMGMSTPGELRRLSLLGRPDVALFTVVRPVHLEFFDGLRGIAEAKAELLAGLAADGLVVANADDPEVARIAQRYLEGPSRSEGSAETGGTAGQTLPEGMKRQGGIAAATAPATGGGSSSGRGGRRRVVWYGIRAAAQGMPVDVSARDLAPGPGGTGSRFVLHAGAEAQAVHLPLHGLYNVENCLAAAACAFALGVSLADIAAAAEQARPAAGRGVVHRVRLPDGELTVIDDSYNSNPDALAKALAGAAQLPAARRLAVLGDMLELGSVGPRFHREGGLEAARLGFAPLAGVGELARELVAGARHGGLAAAWFPDAGAAADWVAAEARQGDVVLVKGSRGVGLDGVVRRLLALGEGSS